MILKRKYDARAPLAYDVSMTPLRCCSSSSADRPALAASAAAQAVSGPCQRAGKLIGGSGGSGPGLTQRAKDEDLAPRHLVRQCDGDQSANGGQDGVQKVVCELLRAAADTDVLEDDRVEVPEAVARELAKEGNQYHLGEAPAAAVGEQERPVCTRWSAQPGPRRQ